MEIIFLMKNGRKATMTLPAYAVVSSDQLAIWTRWAVEGRPVETIVD